MSAAYYWVRKCRELKRGRSVEIEAETSKTKRARINIRDNGEVDVDIANTEVVTDKVMFPNASMSELDTHLLEDTSEKVYDEIQINTVNERKEIGIYFQVRVIIN